MHNVYEFKELRIMMTDIITFVREHIYVVPCVFLLFLLLIKRPKIGVITLLLAAFFGGIFFVFIDLSSKGASYKREVVSKSSEDMRFQGDWSLKLYYRSIRMLNGYRNISPLFALNDAIITSIRFIKTMIKTQSNRV